jgi:hypothetical protein
MHEYSWFYDTSSIMKNLKIIHKNICVPIAIGIVAKNNNT